MTGASCQMSNLQIQKEASLLMTLSNYQLNRIVTVTWSSNTNDSFLCGGREDNIWKYQKICFRKIRVIAFAG
jgi:hypothetical protein